MSHPPLAPLHVDAHLSPAKLELMRRVPTSRLLASLAPGSPGSLKTRPDGTLLEGHHRVHVLRERGIDVDALPREVLTREVAPREVTPREVLPCEVVATEAIPREVALSPAHADGLPPGEEEE